MKCLKCGKGELKTITQNGKTYAKCDKCGNLFTADDIQKSLPRSPVTQTTRMELEPEEDEGYEDYSLGKIATISGWVLCALFLMFGLACGGLSIVPFVAGAVLVSPLFRDRVYLSGKIWIPLVVVLFCVGAVLSPQTDTEPKKIADKQETADPAKKQDKKDAKKEKAEKEETERTAQEQAEREEQERIAQEQAEQERIAQEQALAQAEQERIAQEQAAAQQAEQERLAQEQAEQERIAQEQAAAAQAEQERIAQEQAAAQQAEQERIAQEQAAQANAGQNPFDLYDNPEQQQTSSAYVLNMNTKKFHYPHCNDVRSIAPHNYATSDGSREDTIDQGYSSCGHCNP